MPSHWERIRITSVLTFFPFFLVFAFLFFLFLLFHCFFLFLLLDLGFFVPPLRRLQVTLLFFVFLFFLRGGLGRLCHSDLWNAARGEHAVASCCYAARNEGAHTGLSDGQHAASPLGVNAAGHRSGCGWVDRWWNRGDGVVSMAKRTPLQLFIWILQHQLSHGQPWFARLRGAAWAQRACGRGYKWAVYTGGHTHHVIHDTFVLRVPREAETKCALQMMGQFLACSLIGCCFGYQQLKVGPLWDVGVIELFRSWAQRKATQTF